MLRFEFQKHKFEIQHIIELEFCVFVLDMSDMTSNDSNECQNDEEKIECQNDEEKIDDSDKNVIEDKKSKGLNIHAPTFVIPQANSNSVSKPNDFFNLDELHISESDQLEEGPSTHVENLYDR